MSNGKGDTRRPRAITRAEEAQRWDATFGTPGDIIIRANDPNDTSDPTVATVNKSNTD